MIHRSPSNSTPIFLSARATPDEKLAYGLLYQLPLPHGYFVPHLDSRAQGRRTHVAFSAPQLLALFESWEPTLAPFVPPRTTISNPTDPSDLDENP